MTTSDFGGGIIVGDGINLENSVPASTTNTLYNDAGTLKFNGSAVGGGSSYTAGSGLTLVGTEFNIYGGSGHFHEIIFNSGEQSTTDSRDGIRILTETEQSSSYFANIKIGGGLDLYTATGNILYDSNIFIGYNIASGLDNTGYSYKPYSNVFVGNQISQNCEFVAGSVGIGNAAFSNSRYVGGSIAINGGFSYTDTVVNSVAFNGAGGGNDEIKDSFLWGGLCTNNATIIKDSIGLGFGALASASGQYNVSLGYAAGFDMKGNNNVSIDQNTAISTVIGTNSNKINLCQVIVGDHSSKLLAIGNVGSADLTPDATLEVKPNAATDVGLIVQAATSHSASLQEWQNSSETKLLAVGPDGGLEIPSNVPSTTTNKFYNNGGTLYFNGSAVNTDTNTTYTAGTGLSLSSTTFNLDFSSSAIVTEVEGISSNDNDTTLPTSAAVKDYVDNNAGASYTAGSGLTLVGAEFNVHGGSGHFINLDVDGAFTAVTKSFLIDHPSKEGMKLQYASLEGPENGVYVRGTTKETFITLPNYWRDLVHNSSITVTLTSVGSFQPLFVESKSSREIIVGGVCGYYDYVVYGERKDTDKLKVEW